MKAPLPDVQALTDEPILGWRVWHLSVEPGTGPRLRPAGSGLDGASEWPPMRASIARCGAHPLRSWRRRDHPAPDADCTCGIYASRSLADFERGVPAYPPPCVVGMVSLWGRVIEHSRGWRAELAYPARLRLVCALCAWYEPGTGTPEVVHTFGGLMFALCTDHRGGIELPGGRRTTPTDRDPGVLQAQLLGAYAVDLAPSEAVEGLCARARAQMPASYVPVIRPVRQGPQG